MRGHQTALPQGLRPSTGVRKAERQQEWTRLHGEGPGASTRDRREMLQGSAQGRRDTDWHRHARRTLMPEALLRVLDGSWAPHYHPETDTVSTPLPRLGELERSHPSTSS